MRSFLIHSLNHPSFEWIMICLIIVSSVELALDNPLNDPNSIKTKSLQAIDYSLTFLFVLEAVTKIIAFGFINCGSKSYMKNPWNILDLSVILITVSK
jgi:Ion transport protein